MAVPGVAIPAVVVEVVVALEQAVMPHHPVVSVVYERTQNGGGHGAVVVRRQGVADVVQQGADHGFVVRAVAFGARGGLQRVRVAIHLIAEPIAAQGLEQPQQRVWNALAAIGVQRREEGVLLSGAVRHAREGDFPHERLADAAARLRWIRML